MPNAIIDEGIVCQNHLNMLCLFLFRAESFYETTESGFCKLLMDQGL